MLLHVLVAERRPGGGSCLGNPDAGASQPWRAQLLGWDCLYVPSALGYHVRRVLPERRADVPAMLNRHSVKNRFLMRVKNADAAVWRRCALPERARDRRRLPTIPGVVPGIADRPRGCVFNPRCGFATDRCRTEKPELAAHGDHLVACFETARVKASS